MTFTILGDSVPRGDPLPKVLRRFIERPRRGMFLENSSCKQQINTPINIGNHHYTGDFHNFIGRLLSSPVFMRRFHLRVY